MIRHFKIHFCPFCILITIHIRGAFRRTKKLPQIKKAFVKYEEKVFSQIVTDMRLCSYVENLLRGCTMSPLAQLIHSDDTKVSIFVVA